MEIDKIDREKLYTIKGTGRHVFYKITALDKSANKVYLTGVNTEDYGYCNTDRLRVFSNKFAADYLKWAKKVIKEIEKRYTKLY